MQDAADALWHESSVFPGRWRILLIMEGKIMTGHLKNVRRLMRDEEGATAIEYALLASLIAVVIAVAVGELGTNVNGLFTRVVEALP